MKLLLISDESLDENKGGFSQTLFNVFSFLNPEDLLFITSKPAAVPGDMFTKRTLTYNIQLISIQKNRLGKYFNKLIDWINYSINYQLRHYRKLQHAIRNFDPDVVVVAPNKEEGLFMYIKLKAAFHNKKVIPYFMDDWLRNSRLSWTGTNIQLCARRLLKESKAWLMISENLADIFKERYHVVPERILEVHNPVNVSNLPEVKPPEIKDEYVFVYAGSIWQMHFDSLLTMAKAINFLKQKRKLRLIVYTPQQHWEWRKDDLNSLGVEYGGFIPYKNIHQKLEAADFLLLTSSFDQHLFTHTTSSIQTKITDYLKAGRLIISCGPAYSANHKLLKKHVCGICIESQDEKEIAEELDIILQQPAQYQKYISNGLHVLMNHFSFEKVHFKTQSFFQEC
ncbi:MAG TPA: glycosyltransferase [Parafilimonas sp.]|nr:glycosyltransferase [Parafilimonas sp.]